MLNRQKLLETEMVKLGVKRYRDENSSARKGKHEATTPPGIQFIRKSVAKVSRSIEDLILKSNKGQPLNYSLHALEKLAELEPTVQAFLALKGCVNHLSTPVRLVKVAQEIGGFIEDEARFRYFEKTNPALFGTVIRDLAKRTTNYKKQKRVLVHSAKKDDIEWGNWTTTVKIELGQLLIDLICQTTLIFEIKKYTSTKQERSYQEIIRMDRW